MSWFRSFKIVSVCEADALEFLMKCVVMQGFTVINWFEKKQNNVTLSIALWLGAHSYDREQVQNDVSCYRYHDGCFIWEII